MSHVMLQAPPPSGGYEKVLGRSFRASYDTQDDVWSGEAAMGRLAPRLLPRLAPESRVLDVGAGRGRDARLLLHAGHRVDAVDLVATPDWPHICRQFPGRARFIEGDATTLALAELYDAVLDNGCLHHQHPDIYPVYLARLHRWTVAGGLLALSLFTPAGTSSSGTLWQQHDGRLTRDFTPAEAREMLDAAGWDVEEVELARRVSASHHYLAIVARRRGG